MIGIPVIAGIQVAVTGIVIGDYCITYKYGKKEMFYMQIIFQRGLPQLSIAEGSNHQTGITTEQRAEKGITYETFTYHGEKRSNREQ
mgnify:CR=1 FL=1